jgi:hypothetical protein
MDLKFLQTILVPERTERLPGLRKKASDKLLDASGSFSISVADSVRFIAVAAYLSTHDVAMCRAGLAESASIYLTIFERFDAGEPISRSYVSMGTNRKLFDALAAGDFDLAKTLATRMGGRDEIEKVNDRPLMRHLGYSLKHLVLGDRDLASDAINRLQVVCENKSDANFAGYATVLASIISGDAASAATGMKQVIFGHKRLSKGNGLFKQTEDELPCVWGVGLANLCAFNGIAVELDDPLIPRELLMASK